MAFRPLLSAVSLAVFVLSGAQASFAQTGDFNPLAPTPREIFAQFITDGSWQTEVPDEAAQQDLPAEEIPLDMPETTALPAVFPFYMSAPEYLEARGEAAAMALTAKYELLRKNLKTGDTVNALTLTLQIGPDYAAMTSGSSTRIYDFRTEREINIRQGSMPVFDSRSLYAGALRDINLINKNTDRGKTEQIELSESLSLDAFWLETSLGWTARNISDRITIDQSDETITARYDDREVLNMTLGGPELTDPKVLASLIAFWHQDGLAHPAILAELAPLNALPDSITVLSFSPTTPTGLQTKWTLKESDIAKAEFPLDPSIPNIVTTTKAVPLTFVVDQAARGKALGGEPGLNKLREQVSAAAKKKDWFSAWVDATTLARRQGGCENDPALLCEDIKTLNGYASEDPTLDLVLRAQAAQTSEARLDSLKALLPSIKDKTAPAAVLKAAGILRSKLKTELSEDLIKISAASLLENALIKDPYDPETYHALSQVYAAQGRYAESWDLLDSLRRMDGVPERYTSPVASVEKSLNQRAPGYFIPDSTRN